MADRNLEAGFLLQKCQECDFPDHDHSQSLYLALERQNHFIHGQVSDIIPRVNNQGRHGSEGAGCTAAHPIFSLRLYKGQVRPEKLDLCTDVRTQCLAAPDNTF